MSKTQSKTQSSNPFPFRKQDISVLLMLEESNNKNMHEKSIVNQLIDIYAKLVEFYDANQDPIRYYFMDKMQTTIFKFNKVKNKRSSQKEPSKPKEKPKRAHRHTDMGKYGENKNKPKTQVAHDIDELMEKRKVKRGHEIRMARKYEMAEKLESVNLKNKLEKFNVKSDKNHTIVKSQLNSQDSKIKQKLMARREQSINRSMQKRIKEFRKDDSTSSSNFEGTYLGFKPKDKEKEITSMDEFLLNIYKDKETET